MRRIVSSLIAFFLIWSGAHFSYAVEEVKENEKIPIRIAYPTATLTNGQIGQVLMKTNILEKNNLIADIKGFQYGPPMMEALVSDKVDVAFTSEVPASLPLAKGHEATIIATFGHLGRGAIMVLEDSPIKHTKDLKGKKVGVPFGSSPHRNLLGMLRRAGLEPDVDVQVLNIGRDEVAPSLLKRGVNAIMIWDPAVEQYRVKKGFRIVEAEPFYSVVIMNNAYIEKYPEGVVDFIKSLKEAVLYWVTHKDVVNKWFGEVSRLDPEVIDVCSEVNLNYRNVKKISDVDVSLSDDFIDMMKKSSEFTAVQKVVPRFDILEAINPQFKEVAGEKLNDNIYDASEVVSIE